MAVILTAAWWVGWELAGGSRSSSPSDWPYLQPADLLGDSSLVAQDRYKFDYSGWSPHGKVFTLDELDFDPADLCRAVRRPTFPLHPRFAGFRRGYEGRLRGVAQSGWCPTPVDADTRANPGFILRFNNLNDERRSSGLRRLAEAPGCYYASFGAYPVGSVFCLLNPSTGRVYILHKR